MFRRREAPTRGKAPLLGSQPFHLSSHSSLEGARFKKLYKQHPRKGKHRSFGASLSSTPATPLSGMCYPCLLVICSSLVLFVVLSLFLFLNPFLSLYLSFSPSISFLFPFSSSFSCFSFCQSHPLSLAFCFSFLCNAVLLLFLCSISVSQSVYDYYCHSLCVFLSVSVAY